LRAVQVSRECMCGNRLLHPFFPASRKIKQRIVEIKQYRAESRQDGHFLFPVFLHFSSKKYLREPLSFAKIIVTDYRRHHNNFGTFYEKGG
ncbi:UNVERIFIED_CONTAM: hypothetical protein PO554_26315, partial [Klebsiella pneumoniae]